MIALLRIPKNLSLVSMAVVLAVVFAAIARAEHRVALVIDNSQHKDQQRTIAGVDVAPLVASLEKRGFRCQVAKGVEESKLKSTVEGFAISTPTRGTALVYFVGPVSRGKNRDRETLLIAGVSSASGRGYSMHELMNALAGRGGSLVNLAVVHSSTILSLPGDLPQNCQFSYIEASTLTKNLQQQDDLLAATRASGKDVKSSISEGVKLTGNGSRAISPPGKFAPGKKAGDEWVNSRGLVFCWCPPGKFTMGSSPDTLGTYADEVQRPIEIRDGFWIAKYEITNGQWSGHKSNKAFGDGKLLPVHSVSQSKDTRDRTLKPLTADQRQRGHLPADWEYFLPSEAQWEYAAKAGTSSRYFFGDSMQSLPQHANFGDKSFYDSKDIYANAAHRVLDDGNVRLAVVGSYQPNSWGLHDVYGNVAEWCDNATIRGGSWVSIGENCRSAYRQQLGDRDKRNYVGCRFVIRKVAK